MTRFWFARRSLSFLLVGATVACAQFRASNSSNRQVRVTKNESDVQGCEKVTEVRARIAVTKSGIQEELEQLARSRDCNVLLLSESGDGRSGMAYRCSGVAAGSTQK